MLIQERPRAVAIPVSCAASARRLQARGGALSLLEKFATNERMIMFAHDRRNSALISCDVMSTNLIIVCHRVVALETWGLELPPAKPRLLPPLLLPSHLELLSTLPPTNPCPTRTSSTHNVVNLPFPLSLPLSSSSFHHQNQPSVSFLKHHMQPSTSFKRPSSSRKHHLL